MVREMRSKAVRSTGPVAPLSKDNRTIKVVCEGSGHARRSSIIDRISLRRRASTCEEAVRQTWGDESALSDLARQGLQPSCRLDQTSDRQRPSDWCSQCAGSDWAVSQSGREYLLGDDHVARKTVVGDRHGVPDADLMRTTRQRYTLACDCGLRAEMRHEVMDRIFSGIADEGKSRVLLSRIVAMLDSNR